MKGWFILILTVLFPSVRVAQETPTSAFHDDLLEHLVGKWDVKGIVHGRPTSQTPDKVTFRTHDACIASRLVWQPEARTWRIVSNVTGESKPIIDLEASRAK